MSETLPYIIELLTPKQNDEQFEKTLEIFSRRYLRVHAHGAVVSIPDNPLGNLHFTAMETVNFLTLPLEPERTLLHVNTFHRKADLDGFLHEAKDRGLKKILVVSGDGGPRLTRLEPEDLGVEAKTVTSVELLGYIAREYPGSFTCGVAFNQYEPPEMEWDKLRAKVAAGAGFIITQPVIQGTPEVARLSEFGLPVWAGAWMSHRIDRFLACVGQDVNIAADYSPEANLSYLDARFGTFGIYLSQISFKKDWNTILTRKPPFVAGA
jgi:methylenetetrahydrofolate reductase (NADPH)